MDTDRSVTNAANLDQALSFLERLLRARLEAHHDPAADVTPPELAFYDDGSPFGEFIREHHPSYTDYVLLVLALAPHVRPAFLDRTIAAARPEGGDWPELGGQRDPLSRALLPTGETAAFLLAGEELKPRFAVQRALSPDGWLVERGVLRLEEPAPGAPLLSGRLLIDPEYVQRFTLGRVSTPGFGTSFPAREITTALGWDDLILDAEAMEQIDELRRWVRHEHALMHEWGMGRTLRPGYRVLFHGPPGTGKTLTASLLGKATGRRIFRVDLSTVVSKYVGETEKNLAGLFDRADRRGWILFFDEADALFGKRSGVKDANDRFANQEISYLLQRVEDFDGLVILASNLKANIDDAFLRRFNAIVRFAMPDAEARERLWRGALPRGVALDPEDLPARLARHELSGGNIINAVQHACLAALDRGDQTLRLVDALGGIRREMEKEGRIFAEPTPERVEPKPGEQPGAIPDTPNGLSCHR